MSDLPPLRRPYRAVALLHAGLAIVILVFAAITGGDMTRAVAFAVAYFVLATGWSWFRFRQRERRAVTAEEKGSPSSGSGSPGRNGSPRRP